MRTICLIFVLLLMSTVASADNVKYADNDDYTSYLDTSQNFSYAGMVKIDTKHILKPPYIKKNLSHLAKDKPAVMRLRWAVYCSDGIMSLVQEVVYNKNGTVLSSKFINRVIDFDPFSELDDLYFGVCTLSDYEAKTGKPFFKKTAPKNLLDVGN